MALITTPMNAAMKKRAKAALVAAEMDPDTELSPREFRALVLRVGTEGLSPEEEASFRDSLAREGWFTSDPTYSQVVDNVRTFAAKANERTRV